MRRTAGKGAKLASVIAGDAGRPVIELELQNEELLRAQAELEASRALYFDLYDMAPVGYLTVSEQGLILEANLTAAKLFGVARKQAVNQPLARFIFPEDQDVYYHHRQRLLETGSAGSGQDDVPQECEIRLLGADGSARWVQIRASAVRGSSASPGQAVGATVCRVVVSDINDRKHIEGAHSFLSRCGCLAGNEDFFQALAHYLAQSLEMDYVCIDRLLGDDLSAETVAVYNDGKFEDNITYALKGTPCGDVVGKTTCCFPRDVRRMFPKDVALQELKAESYVGTILWSFDGKPIGLIAVIGRKSLANPALAESVLKLVAVRAAGELERRRAEEELRATNAELSRFNQAMVDRELRMVELKKQVNELCKQAGLPRRYDMEFAEEDGRLSAVIGKEHGVAEHPSPND